MHNTEVAMLHFVCIINQETFVCVNSWIVILADHFFEKVLQDPF